MEMTTTREKRKGTKKWFPELRKHKAYYLMILPLIIYFIVFSYLPMIGVYYAFIDYDFGAGIFGSRFVGFQNFEFLFNGGANSIIWKLTRNTVLYNLAFIFIGNFIQIVVAIMLKELPWKRFVKTSQTMMFMPYFVSMVIVGTIVYNLLSTDYGVINGLVTSLGFERIDFYRIPAAWPFIIVIVNVWKGLGYGVVVYMAAIIGIDESIYEAAYVDGASVMQRIIHITLPLLKPTVIILILLSIGGILRGQFDLFYQLVGQNGQLYDVTDIIDTYVYRTLTVSFDMGLGSAAGLYQSVFGMILIFTVNTIVRKLDPENSLF